MILISKVLLVAHTFPSGDFNKLNPNQHPVAAASVNRSSLSHTPTRLHTEKGRRSSRYTATNRKYQRKQGEQFPQKSP
ncbi:hypothetical protein P8452_54177 [Trifolium repens]|nr:hypothetical protein P8452_54177 [Trifolium repens]